MNKTHFLAILLSCSIALSNSSIAHEINQNIVKTPVSNFNKDNLKIIKNNDFTNDFLKILTSSQNIIEVNNASNQQLNPITLYDNANQKFIQGNITAAYKDYKNLLLLNQNNDYINLGLAYKFANVGLFSLSQEAINNILDRELYNTQIQLIKSRLFPHLVLSYDDEVKLAQNYTEIYYNNLAFEVTRDMNKIPERLKRSDYAHYILSQAYYNTKEFNKAISEINKAISINPYNANYQKYKAQIYCETNRLSDSIKILDNLIKQDLDILDYKEDLKALKYYTLAKEEKNRNKSSYYLAKYFLKTNDIERAIKELKQNIAQNKNDYKSTTLLAEIYFKENKLAESLELFEKSYKLNKNYPDTIKGLADMFFLKKDYKNATEYYIKAAKKDNNNLELLIKASLGYKLQNQIDKSVELANKVFKNEHIDAKVYYTASKVDEIKNIQYLKKTISNNPMLVDAWLDLTDIAIKNNRLDLAENYIKPIAYLNAKNAKYFYYKGLIQKKQGNTEQAVKYFQKSLEINPFFEEANKEINSQL